MGNAAERLREWRAARGLKLAEVAELVGCTAGWVSLLERGVERPGLQVGLGIKRVVGIELEDWEAPPRKRRQPTSDDARG